MTLRAVAASAGGGGGDLTNANFVDMEVPAGTKDGVNAAFTLAAAPDPAESLQLIYNGYVLTPAVGFTLSGTNITALAPYLPNTSDGDTYVASYRKA